MAGRDVARDSRGGGRLAGTSRIEGDKVILDGAYPEGSHLRYTLKGRERSGGDELWGMVEANFGRASVSLKRVP